MRPHPQAHVGDHLGAATPRGMHHQARLNAQLVSKKLFNVSVDVLKGWAHDNLPGAIALLYLSKPTQNSLPLCRGENGLGHEHARTGPVDPQVEGHKGLIRRTLGCHVPAGHEGYDFRRWAD